MRSRDLFPDPSPRPVSEQAVLPKTRWEMLVLAFLAGGEIDFVRKPVRKPGRGQLLIGVRANALCGSERGHLAIYTSGKGSARQSYLGVLSKRGDGAGMAGRILQR
jgi:hypothetical protein